MKSIIRRRDVVLGTIGYRWYRLERAARRAWYRLGGRCYACPGQYGRHKYTCEVGRLETLR